MVAHVLNLDSSISKQFKECSFFGTLILGDFTTLADLKEFYIVTTVKIFIMVS